MGSPFAMFSKEATPDASEDVTQRLQKPNITLAEITKILSIPQSRANTLLGNLKPTQGVTKVKTGVGSLFTITQTGAMRIVELSEGIQKTENLVGKIEEDGDSLGFTELMTIAQGRLSQPLWTQLIRDYPQLFIEKKTKNAPNKIKKSNLQDFLKTLRLITY